MDIFCLKWKLNFLAWDLVKVRIRDSSLSDTAINYAYELPKKRRVANSFKFSFGITENFTLIYTRYTVRASTYTLQSYTRTIVLAFVGETGSKNLNTKNETSLYFINTEDEQLSISLSKKNEWHRTQHAIRFIQFSIGIPISRSKNIKIVSLRWEVAHLSRHTKKKNKMKCNAELI